ncbi:MAG: hypothetical protein O2955_09210 [Planctomycetota bacterium]|nr:hypothetical protein [Planctomycetota bacterium]MDA1212686.1 hypothetical protein [Planctomycetota bacterium]
MSRHRTIIGWTIAGVAIVAAAAVVWAVVGIRSRTEDLLGRGPAAPVPSANDAAATPLTSSGVLLTIKQRSNAWLPGGKLKLHLDDITGQQVIVSVTDDTGRVTLAPKSVKQGDRISISDMEITVVRLENLLVGSGDFGEFEVKPKQ